ncbi:MAG: prolipoprotein diacylglyceryl transferase [Clostridiales bacterium]|jgi:phosphatidylglycerol:prolipoprotein diacylglycerol transferase|nr:prolipoprotein diacylglyceryl transferase [Clostridiales bacterium]
MFPFFDFFGRSLPLYGIMGVVGLFAAAAVAHLRAKKQGLVFMDMALGVLILGVGLVVGGSLMFAIVQMPIIWENRALFWDAPLHFLSRVFGGMVFYGGLFGALIALPIYSKVIKRDIPTILGLLVPVLPLAHGIMRIGCFLAGCCYGIPHETLGIAFTNAPSAPNNIPLLPVQLIEAAANFLIFAALWLYSKKPRNPLVLLAIYGLSYATIRFALEFLRGDAARGFVLGLSTSQFISILIILASITTLVLIHRKQKKAEKSTLL